MFQAVIRETVLRGHRVASALQDEVAAVTELVDVGPVRVALGTRVRRAGGLRRAAGSSAAQAASSAAARTRRILSPRPGPARARRAAAA